MNPVRANICLPSAVPDPSRAQVALPRIPPDPPEAPPHPPAPHNSPRSGRSQKLASSCSNLDYVMNRMETRHAEEKWAPSDQSSYYSHSMNTTKNSTMQTPRSSYRYPSFYNSSFCSSQRSLLQAYDKDRCRWSGYCKAFVVITILLLVAWGIAVPLYFTIGPGTLPWDTGDPPAAHPLAQVATETSKHSLVIVPTAVNCSLRILNEQFSEALDNKYSNEFQSLRLKVETLVNMIFYKDINYDKCVVTNFRPGSVQVDFVLLYTKRRPDIKEYSHSRLVNHFLSHWSMLGNYRVELSSLQVNYISNKCAAANGGCSHACVWTLLGEGYECQCPVEYTLMADRRTCARADKPSVVTTLSPCGPGHFTCASGTCIPGQWLCDRIKDCPGGEDELPRSCHSAAYVVPPSLVSQKLLKSAVSLFPSYNSIDYYPEALSKHFRGTKLDTPETRFPSEPPHALDLDFHTTRASSQPVAQPQQQQRKDLQQFRIRDEFQSQEQELENQMYGKHAYNFKYDSLEDSIEASPPEEKRVKDDDAGKFSDWSYYPETTTTQITVTQEPVAVDKPRPKPYEFTIPGLSSDLNGSYLKDSGKVKDPGVNGAVRRFNSFG